MSFKAIIEKGLLLLWRHIEFYLVYMDGSENLKGDLFSNECNKIFFSVLAILLLINIIF